MEIKFNKKNLTDGKCCSSTVNVNGVSSLTAGVAPNPVWVATTNDANSVPENYFLCAGVIILSIV